MDLHWMSKTRIYWIWHKMKQRCNNNKNSHYQYYWWRWITYDPKWEKFIWFYEDMKEWYSDELSIDRIDNNWNYSKSNCKWSTSKEQSINRKRTINFTYKWKTQCLKYWCNDLWINYKMVHKRVRRWRTIEKSLNL